MTNTAYPDYIEILKLRKAHPIYQIAALILGIDPRTLKLMPTYNEANGEWEYLPESKSHMYLSIKASKMKLEDYLLSEATNHMYVPLLKLGNDLGRYAPSMSDVLYQELKDSIIAATRANEIDCVLPTSSDEAEYIAKTSEGTLVKVESLRRWLAQNNFNTPFFERITRHDGIPAVFDKNHKDHSPELAIALEAWIRFSDLGISHPKTYIENWLEDTFPTNKFETSGAVEMVVSREAKNRIATMVNWNSRGGQNVKAYSRETYSKGLEKLLIGKE